MRCFTTVTNKRMKLITVCRVFKGQHWSSQICRGIRSKNASCETDLCQLANWTWVVHHTSGHLHNDCMGTTFVCKLCKQDGAWHFPNFMKRSTCVWIIIWLKQTLFKKVKLLVLRRHFGDTETVYFLILPQLLDIFIGCSKFTIFKVIFLFLSNIFFLQFLFI